MYLWQHDGGFINTGVSKALRDGPWRIRRRKEAVIVMAEEQYERLAGTRLDFRQYLMQGESLEGAKLARDQSLGRDVSL